MQSGQETEKDKSGKKGFAALSTMVSDVDATVTHAKTTGLELKVNAARSTAPEPAPDGHRAHTPNRSPNTNQQFATHRPGHSPSTKWILGVAAAIAVIWLLSESPKTPSLAPPISPLNQPSVRASPAPTKGVPEADPQPQVSTRPSEEKPQVGTNNVLGVSQIRYCLAETIRIEAARDAVNNYIESDVDRFNGMVTDYNARCSQFRYRQGSLEVAKADIEGIRSILEAEGRRPFTRERDHGPRPTSSGTEPPPNTLDAATSRLDADSPSQTEGAQAAVASANRSSEASGDGDSRDIANFRRCIDGSYPSLCNHAILTPTEAAQVEAAERRANLDKCMDGRYPTLCDHSLLTPDQSPRVAHAERSANLAKCMDGRYPTLCNHNMLTPHEATQVDAAERRINLDKCMDGRYPTLCDHTLLTSEQALVVKEVELRAGRKN